MKKMLTVIKEFYKNNKKNKFMIFCIIISIVLLLITIYRSCNSSITYDESFTYLYYSKNSIFSCLKGYVMGKNVLANNHILNSFLISIFTKIFNTPYNEFVIRLPNIIFYFFFLIYSYKLSKLYKNPYFCFSILVFNYGLHEYFGLARGYGIAASLILIGLYYYKEWILKKDNKILLLVYLILGLSCYANTLSLFVISVVGIDSLIRLYKNKILLKFIVKYKWILLLFAILGIMIIRYHFVISSEGLPLYSSRLPFIDSVVTTYFYEMGINNKTVSVIVFIIFNLLLISSLIKNKFKNNLCYMFYIALLFVIVLTKLFDKAWITNRELLPFVPLISFALFEALNGIKINKYIRYVGSICLIGGMILMFSFNVKLTYYRDWKDNKDIKEVAYNAYIDSNNEKSNEKIKMYLGNFALLFYREEIYMKYNYNILSFIDE